MMICLSLCPESVSLAVPRIAQRSIQSRGLPLLAFTYGLACSYDLIVKYLIALKSQLVLQSCRVHGCQIFSVEPAENTAVAPYHNEQDNEPKTPPPLQSNAASAITIEDRTEEYASNRYVVDL